MCWKRINNCSRLVSE